MANGEAAAGQTGRCEQRLPVRLTNSTRFGSAAGRPAAPHGQLTARWSTEHIGSAHDEVELEALKAVGRRRLAGGQGELDLGLQPEPCGGGSLPITSSRMGHLWDALTRVMPAS